MRSFLSKEDIQESIRYAAIIQSALLPDLSLFEKYFPGSFIFFRPRDIVSGDFYWFHRKKNRIAAVAADSTGHGVPGAFMSIMGINYLNQITSACIPHSNVILNQLREYVMKAFSNNGTECMRREGMDMTVCVFDMDKKQIEFSGALNSMIYFRNNKLFQIRGDRMPVGTGGISEESFTRQVFSFSNVDIIYLFSDGYPDQFGGPEGKKFKYQGFREMLSKIQHLSPKEQLNILSDALNNWIGKSEQVDDILVMGINIQSIKDETNSF